MNPLRTKKAIPAKTDATVPRANNMNEAVKQQATLPMQTSQ